MGCRCFVANFRKLSYDIPPNVEMVQTFWNQLNKRTESKPPSPSSNIQIVREWNHSGWFFALSMTCQKVKWISCFAQIKSDNSKCVVETMERRMKKIVITRKSYTQIPRNWVCMSPVIFEKCFRNSNSFLISGTLIKLEWFTQTKRRKAAFSHKYVLIRFKLRNGNISFKRDQKWYYIYD